MIASRVRRVLTHALNQIAPVSGYPGRMLALLRKTPAHNGFPFTQERRNLMERAREQLTLLEFAPCKIDGMPGFRYQLPAGHVDVCSTIHTDGTTMRISWMVTLYRHSTRGWSEMRTIGEDLDALGPSCHTAVLSLLRPNEEDTAYRPRRGLHRALLR